MPSSIGRFPRNLYWEDHLIGSPAIGSPAVLHEPVACSPTEDENSEDEKADDDGDGRPLKIRCSVASLQFFDVLGRLVPGS